MKARAKLLLLLSFGLAACASAPPRREIAIERWSENHPQAARELGLWVREHPQAAPLFFEWDGQHPEKSREFVTWSIYNPAQPIEGFVATHPGWAYFDRIMESHRPAAESFMMWCRRHPAAAEALMSHPGALKWAGHHLYAADWHMETQP
jgi:hypothetical protein